MTFSIVGRDPQTGELGIAVQSKFLAVGAVVPWAKAGVGAIATQAWANTSYGPRGLELLASGLPAAETIAQLTNEDEGRASLPRSGRANPCVPVCSTQPTGGSIPFCGSAS